MNTASNSPLRITDLTFRDGHQSLLATRLRTGDLEKVAEDVGRAGYCALEVWGGATFDSMHRFLGEDPWERPRRLRRLIPARVQFMMLLRGQNLVGYRNYADDVVEAFVEEAAEAGIDIFRVFDALNDERNLEAAARAILRVGKHFQAALSYTVTGGRMGGPLFTLEYWVGRAKALAALGAHSLCVKDMAGLLSPDDAARLIPALKQATGLPIELHTHCTAGLAEYTLLRAIDAGVDVVDTCAAPLANRTSHPAVEPLAFLLKGSPRDPGLDFGSLERVAAGLEKLLPPYRKLLDDTRLAIVDIGALSHQVPGGMLSNLVNQLREVEAESRLGEVFEELPRVRQDLGFPPLVTPTSQIVGVQAVQNVLFGKPGSIRSRYAMITDQVKDYCYGLYGRPPAPIQPELLELALQGYPRGATPITCRPGDILAPELPKARSDLGELAQDRRELLLATLFPTTGKRFLRVRRGLEPAPAEWQPPAPGAAAGPAPKAAAPSPPAAAPAPAQLPGAKIYRVRVEDEIFEVEVAPAPSRPASVPASASPPPASRAAPAASAPVPAPAAAPATEAASASDPGAVLSPMPGTVIRYAVKEGERVEAGATVVVVEAMKMENRLPAPRAGTVRDIRFKPGDRVARNAVLLTIG